MAVPRHIDVYGLDIAANVCQQALREVISLPSVSMAHVLMERGAESLWHKHSRMSEVYVILSGEGILYHGERSLHAEPGAYLVIPPGTPHMLVNGNGSTLEHLVFASPPFDPDDVVVVDERPEQYNAPEAFWYDAPPIEAADGALVYELMRDDERQDLGMALAFGVLPAGRRADPHHHMVSEELYYVVNGEGTAVVGDREFGVARDSLVYVPVGYSHALENTHDSENLEVLCISSPPYSDADFFRD